MAMAETAKLAVDLSLHDGLTPGLSKAEGELAAFNRQASSTSAGFTKLGAGARAFGGAMGHAKSQIAGLMSGPLGMIGLGAGLVGVTKFFTDSVNEAARFGANVEKVARITNLSAQEASAMVDTLDKWGVASERLIPMLGRMEKNVGALAATDKKAAAFRKQFNFELTDGKGKIADANTLLLRAADYFNSSATATQKATVMSKLFGKAWQDMVPVLSKGSDFIRKQERDSIHLTATQLSNIVKFRNAQREFADAFGDLQVKIGSSIMPMFTRAATGLSTWIDQHGDEVASTFGRMADDAARLAKSALDVFGQIKSGWDSLPPEFRDLLVKGIVAQKTIKFLFGFDPLKAIGGLAGGMLSRGGSPANPVWVASAGGGIGGPAGAAGGLSAAGVLTAAGLGVGIAAAYKILVQDPQLDAQQRGVAASAKRQLDTGSISEIATGLRAIKTGIADIAKIPGGKELYKGQFDFLTNLQKLYEARLKELGLREGAPEGHRIRAGGDRGRTDARRRQGLGDLTDRDLRRATKEGITEGNRDSAKRRDIDSMKLTLGMAIRDAKHGIQQTEMAGMREIRGGVSLMTSILSGVLTGGFGNVVAAIGNISLPAYLPSGPGSNVNRKQGGRGGVRDHSGASAPSNEGNRGAAGRRVLQVHMSANVSSRQVDSGTSTQRAYGPTATRAGAAGVLIDG